MLFPERGRFIVGGIDQPFSFSEQFDAVMALGVLHHLDDGEVAELMRKAERHLRPGGRLITVDPCFVEGQGIIAKTLAEQDRGKFVRAPDEYQAAAQRVFSKTEMAVRSDLLRLPYTHTIIIAKK